MHKENSPATCSARTVVLNPCVSGHQHVKQFVISSIRSNEKGTPEACPIHSASLFSANTIKPSVAAFREGQHVPCPLLIGELGHYLSFTLGNLGIGGGQLLLGISHRELVGSNRAMSQQ